MPVLIVQRGHCYRKTGATGTTGEQAYAAAVADACFRLLHGKNGWSVRPTLADENYYRGDAFVAIHCDGSTNPSARGASVGYRTPEGQQFGQAWKRAYAARGWTGGFRPDNYTSALAQYYGTGNAVAAGNRRAFIAECGFRTSPDDRALLDGPGGPERVALAIGDALGITQGEDMDQAQNDTLNALAWRVHALINGLDAVKDGPDVQPPTIRGNPMWMVRLMKRIDAQIEVVRGQAEDATTSAMLAADNAVKAAAAAVEASNKVSQLTLGGVDVQVLASLIAPMVADELDRRARDNPDTGPTS